MQQCSDEKCSQPMIVSITSSVGVGTGFFIKENLIATNIHCIAGATSVSAKLLDSNTVYDVQGVAAFDDKNDLVILKVSGKGTPFKIVNSDIFKEGEIVKAVGFIGGKHLTAEGEFRSSVNKGQWLQTTAKTEGGYSGGPLLNSKNQVIGVNFVSRGNISEAISSNIITALVAQTRTIELLDHWQKRKAICAWGYIVQSKQKEEKKDYANVIVCYDEAILLNPDIIKWYYIRGYMKVKLANSESNKGNSENRQRLLQSAIDDYTQTINLCPDFAEAYNDRADARLQLGRIEAKKGNVNISHDLYQDAMNDVNIAINENRYTLIEYPEVAVWYHTRGEIKEAMKNTKHTNESTVSDDLKRVEEALKQQK